MGEMEYEVHDGVGMMFDRSCFAGSTTLLNQMVPILIEEVGIPLPEVMRMASLTPACVIGIDGQKGSLEVGKDADIVVFDPNQKFTITQSKLHMNIDYTPFEGMEVTGMPVAVYSRGKKAAHWNGEQMEFVGEVGRGRFVKREPFEGF